MNHRPVKIQVELLLTPQELEFIGQMSERSGHSIQQVASDLFAFGIEAATATPDGVEPPEIFAPAASLTIPPWACQKCGEDNCICPSPSVQLTYADGAPFPKPDPAAADDAASPSPP